MVIRLWGGDPASNAEKRSQDGKSQEDIHNSYTWYESALVSFLSGDSGEHTGDHIFGLLPLMTSIINGAGGTTDDVEDPRAQRQGSVDIEVGLSGLPHFPSLQDS